MGILMMCMAVFSAAAHLTKQTQIPAALLTGLIFGAFTLDSRDLGPWTMVLPFEVNSKMVELGNNLVLFFAGLSCDAKPFRQYWRAVLTVGSGYLILSAGLLAAVGWGSGLCVGIGSVTFFGVAGSLSSRQLMTEYLEQRQQTRSMHGKLLLGLALFQDLQAVLAFTILNAFQRCLLDLAHTQGGGARRAGAAATAGSGQSGNPWVPAHDNIWHDRFRLGDEIGRALGLFVLVMLIFALLNRYLLDTVFRWFSKDGEMLFIGTMAYNFGAAALCFQVGVFIA